MKIALIQFNAQDDKKANITRAVKLIQNAIDHGAEFILLPEVFNFRGRKDCQQVAEFIPGESLKPLMDLAKKRKVHILAGSIYEYIPRSSKVFNTSVLIDNNGAIKAKYRKINLFSAQLGSKKIRESDKFSPGNKIVTVKIKNFNLGLLICYDLRFPFLFEEFKKKKVNVVCVPSAFTKKTGQAHWEILLRARAIELLSYVLAPNQVGTGLGGVESFGNSLVVGPWGEILAKGSGEREEIVYAVIDKSIIDKCRKVLPVIKK